MASNLNLLCDASSESVDAMMYHQMIGFLMYVMNMRPDICFDVNTEPVLDESETCSPNKYKAYIELPKRYNGLWAQI